jgi:hypothetical protein
MEQFNIILLEYHSDENKMLAVFINSISKQTRTDKMFVQQDFFQSWFQNFNLLSMNINTTYIITYILNGLFQRGQYYLCNFFT